MLSDEQDAEVARIRERWSNGPTGRYPEATEAADQRDIESLLAMLDAARAAERALVERAAWQVQRVINHWSSVPAAVLAEREGELADLAACRDAIAALRPEAATTDCRCPAAAVHPDTEGER